MKINLPTQLQMEEEKVAELELLAKKCLEGVEYCLKASIKDILQINPKNGAVVKAHINTAVKTFELKSRFMKEVGRRYEQLLLELGKADDDLLHQFNIEWKNRLLLTRDSSADEFLLQRL